MITILRTGSAGVQAQTFGALCCKQLGSKSPTAIVICDRGITPLTIPQFWPPDSLDYRGELILPAQCTSKNFSHKPKANLRQPLMKR